MRRVILSAADASDEVVVGVNGCLTELHTIWRAALLGFATMTQDAGADTGKAAEVTYATIRRHDPQRRARRWGVAARGRPRRRHRA